MNKLIVFLLFFLLILYFKRNLPITIIVSCTVNVHNVNTLAMKDSNERKNLYIRSIKNWLNKTNFNIVVVENSGYLFPELQQEMIKFKKRFEIISFIEPKNIQNEKSKGTHEIFAINYAFDNSNIIKNLNNDSLIIKITGRYFIPELENFLNKQQQKNFDIITQNNPKQCEILGCKKSLFKFLFDKKLNYINNEYDNDFIEIIYQRRVASIPKNRILRSIIFQIEPTRSGSSGKVKTYL